MEIKTCEQYVLSELEAKSREVESLEEQLRQAVIERNNAKLRAEELERKLNAEPGALEANVIKEGRERVFDRCTYATVTDAFGDDGKPYQFRVWCEECMKDYGRPKGVSADEFIRFFEPEFRAIYDRKLKEAEE